MILDDKITLGQRLAEILGPFPVNWKAFKSPELRREINELDLPGFDSVPEKVWALLTKTDCRPTCRCGNITSFLSVNQGFRKYCSTKCMATDPETLEKRRATSFDRYGATHWTASDRGDEVRKEQMSNGGIPGSFGSQEHKDAILKKYGVDNVFQSSEIKQKIKETNLARRGVQNPMQDPSIRTKATDTTLARHGVIFDREKIKLRMIERYGVENPLQNPEIRGRVRQTTLERHGAFFNPTKATATNVEKYGVELPMQNPEISSKSARSRRAAFIVDKIRALAPVVTPNFDPEMFTGCDDDYSWTCSRCGNIFQDNLNDGRIPICRVCFPKLSGFSAGEKEMVEFIQSAYQGHVILNSRSVIPPLELDAYIPEMKLAFEFDGIYWHSEAAGKNRSYHLNKTEECERNGIRLIHIFENEWVLKNQIVKSRILATLGLQERIFARKCTVIEISTKTSTDFFNDNHIQGSAGASIHLGLIYRGRLVAAMSFGRPRFNKRFDWELIRFANKLGCAVIGGASRLFRNFINTYEPASIISYSDRRWNTGKIYQTLGMRLSAISGPNYFYFKNGMDLLSRNQFQKHKLSKILEIFDPALTEWENMQANGYNRIFDCGNLVFTWNDYEPNDPDAH